MKTICLKFGDHELGKVLEYLKALPVEGAKVVPDYALTEGDPWYIPPVSDEEQAEIEAELKHPDCRVIVDR
ncbi:MAG: hypothetical protein HQK55_19085, partial [Deltaproteobacteria bacterium]|nr:hypothetical protein [Deltaproteobacteria bacterium]